MKKQEQIFLPGINKQLEFLYEKTDKKFESILVIGAASENIATLLSKKYGITVELIVNDYESLLNSKLLIENHPSINLKLMDYENTDYKNSSFELIYAQASISTNNRKKILKEIKRILKENGFFCLGEVVKLKEPVPPFVQNVFNASNLSPLFIDELINYYLQNNFVVIDKLDLTYTLKDYYTSTSNALKRYIKNATDEEKREYKKILNRIGHETSVYLKLGGEKFIGFVSLLLQKEPQ
ncbi:class I SAM-dependent methyltransferase [Melioribacteraceae bacterium 4301-Me]|uniref:class I SAM-dependent methyltransferase n=1 Tax=Pyranulibacter aquaticus TaxID=3163344 RepID=UPI0035969666